MVNQKRPEEINQYEKWEFENKHKTIKKSYYLNINELQTIIYFDELNLTYSCDLFFVKVKE